MMIIEYDLLEKLCRIIQKEVTLQEIELNFKKVLEHIYINDKIFHLKPFIVNILSVELYDFLFLENEQGIDKEWILLILNITFSNGDFIKIDKVKEIIEIETKDDNLKRKIKEISVNI